MYYFTIGSIVLLTAVLLTGCRTPQGNGDLTEKEYPVAEVARLNISGQWDVTVSTGAETDSCKVTLDDNLFEYLNVRSEKDCLRVGFTRSVNPSSRPRLILAFRKSPGDYILHGQTALQVDQILADEALFDLHGQSSLIVGESTIQSVKLDLHGQSNCSFKGNWEEAVFHIHGQSRVEHRGTINRLEARVRGQSRCKLETIDSARIDLHGQSFFKVRNGKSLTGSTSGQSSAEYASVEHVDIKRHSKH